MMKFPMPFSIEIVVYCLLNYTIYYIDIIGEVYTNYLFGKVGDAMYIPRESRIYN